MTTDKAIGAPEIPAVNIGKLVRYNLTQSDYTRRISRAELQERLETVRERAACVSLWIRIHEECAPARAELRARDEAMENL